MTPELMAGAITALRYVLWQQDRGEWLAAGGEPTDAPPCPVTDADLAGLAAPLAALVVGARRAIAEQLGITDPVEQGRYAYGQLQRELEGLEVSASFAAIDAETAGEGQQPSLPGLRPPPGQRPVGRPLPLRAHLLRGERLAAQERLDLGANA